ncbi:phage terminase large subunit [Aestuariispira ectoiniformans]|uniref:phage terminase large subunit n=1 Tax=Aestuariispira ectoiniformans TaxID=2775080 RepID=UPI00223B5D56|nr:phage terminase large subunit [Aestuariispira ectoiniformans]
MTVAPSASFPEFLWIWNHSQGRDTPDVHKSIARWLDRMWSSQETALLLMAFRACGKSTLVGLFCAWLLTRNPNLRILVLAAEQSLAIRMVRNVKRVLERHPLAVGLKPQRADQWASDRFTVQRSLELRDPSMLARGIGANVTGSRADVVICDDVEVPNTCDTAGKREDLRQRLSEIDYILVPGGMQLYVGTPHSYYTIYADCARPESGEEEPFLGGFERLVIPIHDDRGRPAWPERYGRAAIANLRRRHGPNKFSSQMLLRPVSHSDGRLNPDRIDLYNTSLSHETRNGVPALLLDGKELVSSSCWWDPAYGASGKRDRSVIACVFTDRDGGYWLHAIRYLAVDMSLPTDEARQQCTGVCDFLKEYCLPSVTVETNGVGRFLPGLLRSVLREQGQSVAVVERHNTKPKDKRIIEAFDAVLAAGNLRAHESVAETPFLREMREWRPGAQQAGADDGLDAVAGCLLSEPVRLHRAFSQNDMSKRPDWQRLGQSLRADYDFDL